MGLPSDLAEGTDVTERLGVQKYDPPPPPGTEDFRAPFPRGVSKTDEPRVQSFPGVIDELRGEPWFATLKCDGTSATYLIDPDDGQMHACARNFSVMPGNGAYWRVARALELEERLRAEGGRYAVQGELCGPGIHKNRLGLASLALFVFDAWDLTEHRRVDQEELLALCRRLELQPVPIVAEGTSFGHDLASLLALAEGLYPGTRNEREGIVVRPRRERYSEVLGRRLSFKVISNRYLLAEG